MKQIIFTPALILTISVWGAAKPCMPASIDAWVCYYGSDTLFLNNLNGYDLAILDPDINFFKPPLSSPTLYIGYVSIGEAEKFRWYWPLISKDSSMILWENPNWKDDFLIDIRSSVWQNLLLTHIIPHILKKGYSGIFLDCLDTPLYLQTKDSIRFAGSVDSLVSFIHKIRTQFPDCIILSNNGIEIIPRIAPSIDGIVMESFNTTYDFQTKKYKKADPGYKKYRLSILKKIPTSLNMTVLVIDYADKKSKSLQKFSKTECKKFKFPGYIAPIDLTQIPDREKK